MGVCLYSGDRVGDRREIQLVDIFQGDEFAYDQLFSRLIKWTDDNLHLLLTCDILAIEKQHLGGIANKTISHAGSAVQSCVLQIIQTVLRMWAHAHNKPCVLVMPRDVKVCYGLKANGCHRSNKKDVKEYVRTHHPDVIEGMSGKLDDICDVFLLAKYVLDNRIDS